MSNCEFNSEANAAAKTGPPQAFEELLAAARSDFAAGQIDQARLLCLAGLSEFPDSPQLLTVLGWAHAQRKELRSAEATFRHALCQDACSFDAHAGLAAVLAANERHAEANAHYAKAIALHADDVDTLFNYGCTLIALRRFDSAIDRLLLVTELDPTNVGAFHNLAIAHAQLGRWEATVNFCNRALSIDGNAHQSQLLRGMARVALGTLAEGWDDYESRCRLQDHYGRQFGLKTWNGESTETCSLVVVPEQGIGTQLMFASCLPDLLRRVSRVTLACDPRLVGLMKRSFPSVVTVVDGLLPALIRNGGHDAYTMAGSLPQHLRRSAQSFPQGSYLVAEPRGGCSGASGSRNSVRASKSAFPGAARRGKRTHCIVAPIRKPGGRSPRFRTFGGSICNAMRQQWTWVAGINLPAAAFMTGPTSTRSTISKRSRQS